MQNIETFIDKLTNSPVQIEFSETMAVIDENYNFSPTRFTNGNTVNEAGENNGSCKLYAFAQLQQFNKEQTLACFGHYYRDDVLAHPENDDHQNIRNFMKTGWDGIKFDAHALTPK